MWRKLLPLDSNIQPASRRRVSVYVTIKIMKKIFVAKKDSVAEVAERIVNSGEKEIVLMVPRGANLGASAGNFELLKREADAAGKLIAVESVDDNVLAFARANELDAIHPLFEGALNASSLSDIVPARRDIQKSAQRGKGKRKIKVEVKSEVPEEEASTPNLHVDEPAIGPAPKPPAEPESENRTYARPESEQGAWSEPKPERKIPPAFMSAARPEIFAGEGDGGRRRKIKIAIIATVAILLVLGAMWITGAYFSHATITVNLKKTPWSYEHQFVADTAVSRMNLDKNILPAEHFTSVKNTAKQISASSVKDVSDKATAKLTIYNAYSSKPQPLVATTRFVTPAGKIFRLVSRVVVPGAQIVNGKINPSSIEVHVVADEPGPDYNTDAVQKLVIPGFKGTPKYDAFYGALPEGASGGFVGKKPVPVPEDISAGKEKTIVDLKDGLQADLLAKVAAAPGNYKILDGATNVNITKLNVNEGTDTKGNFTVFGEGNMEAIAFPEADIKSFLTVLAQKDNVNNEFDDLKIYYGAAQANFRNGSETFSLKAQGTLKSIFSADDFKKKVLGQSVDNARISISGIVGLADARISVWPIWLGSIPSDPKRVSVVAQ